MVKSNKSNLKEQDQLAEKVRKFPCFYGKGNGNYKETYLEENAQGWRIPEATKKVYKSNFQGTLDVFC